MSTKDKPLKAYEVREPYEGNCVIAFATNSATARRKGASELDTEWEGVESCTRAPWADQYAPGPVPLHATLEAGWWHECGHCGCRFDNEGRQGEDDDERDNACEPVQRGIMDYCSEACAQEEWAARRELDITQSSILPCMVAAVHHGVVKRDRRDGIVHWSLGDGTALPAPVEEEDDPEMKSKIVLTSTADAARVDAAQVRKISKAIKGPSPKEWPAIKLVETDAAGTQIQLDLPDPEPIFGAFSDGSLSIEQGGTFLRLGEQHAKQLQAFMGKAWNRA